MGGRSPQKPQQRSTVMQLDQQTLDTLQWLSRLDIPENETEALSESIAEGLSKAAAEAEAEEPPNE